MAFDESRSSVRRNDIYSRLWIHIYSKNFLTQFSCVSLFIYFYFSAKRTDESADTHAILAWTQEIRGKKRTFAVMLTEEDSLLFVTSLKEKKMIEKEEREGKREKKKMDCFMQ